MPYIGKSPVGGGFHKLDALTASPSVGLLTFQRLPISYWFHSMVSFRLAKIASK